LPNSSSRLWGAPVVTILAILFLSAVLVSTSFIPGLTWTWIAGVPFFVLLVVVYFFVKRKTGDVDRYDPLQAELTRRDNPGAPITPEEYGEVMQ
jgi:AAT family amino acid transporter